MEQVEKQTVFTIDIHQLLRNYIKTMKRFWWLPVTLAIILGIAVHGVMTMTFTPVYKAQCSFTVKVVNKSTTGEINSLYGFYYDKDLADQLEKTFTYVLTSDFLNDEVELLLGEDFEQGNVESECIEGSNMFTLSVTGDTPESAMALLNAIMEVYPDAARYIVGEMQVDMVEEATVPEKPDNEPDLKMNLLIGALGGFVLGSLILIVPVWNMRTVLHPEELEGQLNMPCLGLVPLAAGKKSEKDGGLSVTDSRLAGEFREGIRGIARRAENYLQETGGNILLVTSTLPGEGKSLLCQNLAETFASWGKRTWLVDGDLRMPRLYQRLRLKSHKFSLEEFLQKDLQPEEAAVKPGSENLWVVCNSTPVEQPTVLIDSPAMKQFISRISKLADIVIVDAPPCDIMSDVIMFQQSADAVLYVVRQDYATINKITDAVENLYEGDGKLMGYVLNGTAKTTQGYGKYGYGAYGYGKYGNGYYGKYGHYSRYDKYYFPEEEKRQSDK